MNKLFRNGTLRQKLTWLATICSIAALTTTAVSLGVYEWFSYRRMTMAHLTTTSAITARNSAAALAFANAEDATKILAALDAEPAVTAAALYLANGTRLAIYRRAGSTERIPDSPGTDGVHRRGADVDIAVPVMEVKRFGTLVVHAELSAISARRVVYGLVVLGTTLVSGMLGYLLTGWLSHRIVEPVNALVRAASGVRTNADYSVRVPKVDDDELGTLTDAFNEMLDRVQQNEVDLYRSAERLRLALESARIGTWDWNLVSDQMTWNARNYEIYGMRPGTPVSGKSFFPLVHPDDRRQVKEAVEGAAVSGADFSVEYRLADLAGTPRYLVSRGRFLRSSAGDPQRAVGVTTDVTERRNAELRAMENELRFRVVAERAPAMIWSCDPSLNRDYVNKTWLNFTGRTPEQERDVGWQENVPPPDISRWRELVGAAANRREPYTIEYRLKRADGALRWVFETGSPRLALDGSFAGYLGSCIDITARKENETELEAHVRNRTRELEAANQELESFSYSVSHDLRGPVRAIQGFAEIALEECQANNPAAALERIERVMKAADRMNKLIDAFIGLARISRFELKVETVNLSRIAAEVVSFLRAAPPGRQVDVVIAPGQECRGDERLLRIVLENLLANAWKFTGKRAQARIEFGSREQEGERVFFVRDNGAGFNPAQSHKLFQPFERLHQASQFDGLGVGLSTVQRAVIKHDGRVWAESKEGEGATFYFTIGGA